MNNEEIRNKLFKLQDLEYRDFHSKLCPGVENIIGIRVPILRKLAKDISKGNWKEYLKNALDEYYEEIMLQGMVIGYIKNIQIEEMFKYIKIFVPKIDNWAVCDVFCSGLKITNKNSEEMWKFIQDYLKSDKEFEIRFAVVMILGYYISDEYIDDVLKILDNIHHDGYYVKMAVAWAISIAFIKKPDTTMKYLKTSKLDNFTYNKALQKITESYRVDKDTKDVIRSLKRKD